MPQSKLSKLLICTNSDNSKLSLSWAYRYLKNTWGAVRTRLGTKKTAGNRVPKCLSFLKLLVGPREPLLCGDITQIAISVSFHGEIISTLWCFWFSFGIIVFVLYPTHRTVSSCYYINGVSGVCCSSRPLPFSGIIDHYGHSLGDLTSKDLLVNTSRPLCWISFSTSSYTV